MTTVPYLEGALATGGFTLLAALGGVLTTQRHARRLADEQRAEDRRTIIRSELTRLVIELNSLVDDAYTQVMFLSRATDADLQEWATTDSGRESGRRASQIRSSLTILNLTVGDPPLLSALALTGKVFGEWGPGGDRPAL